MCGKQCVVYLQWPYEDFISITPNIKQPQTNEFLITMRKGKKTDTMRFSTDHRTDVLTEALRFRNRFAEKNMSSKVCVLTAWCHGRNLALGMCLV